MIEQNGNLEKPRKHFSIDIRFKSILFFTDIVIKYRYFHYVRTTAEDNCDFSSQKVLIYSVKHYFRLRLCSYNLRYINALN